MKIIISASDFLIKRGGKYSHSFEDTLEYPIKPGCWHIQMIIHLVHIFWLPIPCYVTRIPVDWLVQEREHSMNSIHRASGHRPLWGVYALSPLLGLDPAECHGIITTHCSGYRIGTIFPCPHPERQPWATALPLCHSVCDKLWKNRIWLWKCKACEDLHHVTQTSALHKQFKNLVFERKIKD